MDGVSAGLRQGLLPSLGQELVVRTPSPRRCGGSRAPRVGFCVTGVLCVTLTSEQTASSIQVAPSFIT